MMICLAWAQVYVKSFNNYIPPPGHDLPIFTKAETVEKLLPTNDLPSSTMDDKSLQYIIN